MLGEGLGSGEGVGAVLLLQAVKNTRTVNVHNKKDNFCFFIIKDPV